MEIIECQCGRIFNRDYKDSTLLISGESQGYPGRYYSWRCPQCGQEYMERCTAPIIL